MKNMKLILLLFSLLVVSPLVQAQSKVKVPEKLQGFWSWEVAKIGNWDGTLIGADYVEYLYKIYYIDSIKIQGADGYHLWLQKEPGDKMELTITGFNNKKAKLLFSRWTTPQASQLSAFPTNTEMIPLDKLPKSLYREWTNDNKGTVFCKFHDSKKLLFENKEWDIVSAGYYMKREYRLLVRNGNLYNLIYLSNLSNETLKLACNMKTFMLTPIAANKGVYKILGNWIEKINNHWEIGFFEKFAIYKGDFWNYKTLTFNGESANIVLTKGAKQAKIALNLRSEDLSDISFNGLQSKTYLKCGKIMPQYTTPDNTAFKDSHFQKTDSVTIKGYLRNNPLNQPFSVVYWDPIKNGQAEFFADIDALGCFTIKFPLINTTQLYVDWSRMNKMDVVEPGETYFLYYDFSSGQALTSGNNERLHNEMLVFDQYLPLRSKTQEEYDRRERLSPLEFLTVKKEDSRKINLFFDDYMAKNPNLSERFKYFQRTCYRFMIASELMQRRFNLNRNAYERFPAVFMDYVNDSLYQNTPPRPFTLSRDFFFFIHDYTDYIGQLKNLGIRGESLTDEIRNQQKAGRLNLTDEDVQVFAKYGEYETKSFMLKMEKADSTKRAEATKPYIEVIERMMKIREREEIKNFINAEWPKISLQFLRKKRLNVEISNLDSLIKDPQLNELLSVQKFYNSIYEDQSSLTDDVYQLFKDKITSPALAAPIIKLQNHYAELTKQDIFYTESLKRTDHLKESKDADALLAQLIAPYKGKVVYIDFWGTWCGPCKDQMKYTGAVKEALKNKDVIFMYFANRSPEESWKNVIKENHLTGPNVVHYRLTEEQQGMIERRFSVNAFPTYILMDKTGAIVNMKASRPEQKEQLVAEITKLLND